MGKSKLPMPNVRCEKKTKSDAKTSPAKESGASSDKKGVRKLFSWASGSGSSSRSSKVTADARASTPTHSPSLAGEPARTVVTQRMTSPTELLLASAGSRMAFSSSMPDAIASNTREVTQHSVVDEYYTLRPYSPATAAKHHHLHLHHHQQLQQQQQQQEVGGTRRGDWRYRGNTEDLYSELYPLSSLPADNKTLGAKPMALQSFTGAVSRTSPLHQVHPPRPPPCWPLPPTKSAAAHFSGQRADNSSGWTLEDEHAFGCRPDYSGGSNDKFLTSANSSAHIYDEIYTEVEGSDGGPDGMVAVASDAGKMMREQVTLHRLPPAAFLSRPPSATLAQYECAKYVHLAPRLSEGSLHVRYEYDDTRRYIDIESDEADGDDEVFASNERLHVTTMLRQQQQQQRGQFLPLLHQQQQQQQQHFVWSSLGNLSTVGGGVDQPLLSQAERRQARPSCGVWMAKLRATRRIYAELENLDGPAAECQPRGTSREGSTSAPPPPHDCLLSPLGTPQPRSVASTRPSSRAGDSGTLTQAHVSSFCSERGDQGQGHFGVRQSPSVGGIVKYVQTEVSPAKRAVETQTSRTLLRRPAPTAADAGCSSEEYEKAAAGGAGAGRPLTRLPRPSLTGTKSPLSGAAAAAARSPMSANNKRGPPTRRQTQSPASAGGGGGGGGGGAGAGAGAGGGGSRVGRKSSDGGSLSEDAYAGGSESSPESYEDTDSSSYYYSTAATAFRCRSATVDSQRPATAMALTAGTRQTTRVSAMNRSQSSIVPFSSGNGLGSTTYETRQAGGSVSSNVYDRLIDSTRVKVRDSGTSSSFKDRGRLPSPLSLYHRDDRLGAVESELYSLVISSDLSDDVCEDSEHVTTHLSSSIRRVRGTNKPAAAGATGASRDRESNHQMTSSLESAGEDRTSAMGRDSYYEQKCDSQLDRKSLMMQAGAGTSDFSSDIDYAATTDLPITDKRPPTTALSLAQAIATPPSSDWQVSHQVADQQSLMAEPAEAAGGDKQRVELKESIPSQKGAPGNRLAARMTSSSPSSSVVHSRIAQYNDRAALLSHLSPRAISDRTIQHFTFPPSLLPAATAIKHPAAAAPAAASPSHSTAAQDDSVKSRPGGAESTTSLHSKQQQQQQQQLVSSTLPTRIQKLSGSKKLPQPSKPDRRSSPASVERYTQLTPAAAGEDTTRRDSSRVGTIATRNNSPLPQQQQQHLAAALQAALATGIGVKTTAAAAAAAKQQRKIPAAVDTSRAAGIATSSSVPSSPARRTHPPAYCHGQPSWCSGVQHMAAITLSTLPPDCAKVKARTLSKKPSTGRVDNKELS